MRDDKWVIITQPNCNPCLDAKNILRARGIHKFVEFDITKEPPLRDFLVAALQTPTTPQVFLNGYRIGGRDELREYFRGGDLCSSL